MKYIVEVTTSNPSHEHVALRRVQKKTNFVVEANNETEAVTRARGKFRSLGHYVHEAKVINERMSLPDEKDVKTQGKTGAEIKAYSSGEFSNKADRLNQAKVDAVLGAGKYKAGSAKANLALARHFRDKASTPIAPAPAADAAPAAPAAEPTPAPVAAETKPAEAPKPAAAAETPKADQTAVSAAADDVKKDEPKKHTIFSVLRPLARAVGTLVNPASYKNSFPGTKTVGENTEMQYIEEKLTAADPASKWIHDFVHSDNPKFEGKSKKERIQMALGAYYASKRGTNEEAEQIDEASKVPVEGIKRHLKNMYGSGTVKVEKHPDLPGHYSATHETRDGESNTHLVMPNHGGKGRWGIEHQPYMTSSYYGEEVEQIDEISLDLIRRATQQAGYKAYDHEAAAQDRADAGARAGDPEEKAHLQAAKAYRAQQDRLTNAIHARKAKQFAKPLVSAAKLAKMRPKKMISKGVREEVEGKVAVTPKEKELAAHHGDPNRITFGDVLKARLKSVGKKVEEQTAQERPVPNPNAVPKKPTEPKIPGTTDYTLNPDPTVPAKHPLEVQRPAIEAEVQKRLEAIKKQAAAEKKVTKEEVEQVEEKYMGFAAVKKAVAAKGARNPAAVAAYIGRKKYGKEKFQAMAAAGKKKKIKEEAEQLEEAPVQILGKIVKAAIKSADDVMKPAAKVAVGTEKSMAQAAAARKADTTFQVTKGAQVPDVKKMSADEYKAYYDRKRSAEKAAKVDVPTTPEPTPPTTPPPGAPGSRVVDINKNRPAQAISVKAMQNPYAKVMGEAKKPQGTPGLQTAGGDELTQTNVADPRDPKNVPPTSTNNKTKGVEDKVDAIVTKAREAIKGKLNKINMKPEMNTSYQTATTNSGIHVGPNPGAGK